MPGIAKPASFANLLHCRRNAGGKIYFFLIPSGSSHPLFLVKASCFSSGRSYLKNEYENLALLYFTEKFNALKSSIPMPVCLDTYNGSTMLVARFVEGNRFRDLFKLFFIKKYFYKAADWLINFHTKTSQVQHGEKDALKDEFISLKEKIALQFKLEAKTEHFLNELTDFLSNYNILNMPMVFAHNDFTLDNIFFAKEQIYVTDWEYAQPTGLPFVDLFHFCLFYGVWHGRFTADESLLEMYSCKGKYFSLVKPALKKYLESILIEVDTLMPLAALQLMRWALVTRMRGHEMINCINLLANGKTIFSLTMREFKESIGLTAA